MFLTVIIATPAQCTDQAILFRAKIERGYSGGPLIGAKDGAVIGMVVAGHPAAPGEHATHAAVEKDANFASLPAPPPDPHLDEAIALPAALILSEFHRLVAPPVWQEGWMRSWRAE